MPVSPKKVIIIGGGPAGLTAAYELLRDSTEYEVTVLEESGCVGGIARTVNYKGNRMDMGGHRFFSKVPEVNDWWESMLPLQGAMPMDDALLGRKIAVYPGGPDPKSADRVMLLRRRVSRILFADKFYDYPITLKPETFRNMGLVGTVQCGFSYLAALLHKRPENNLENFYINRFGKKLYSMFFEYYTENLWGRHPRDIDASWGSQRVKGLSVSAVLRDIFAKLFRKKNRTTETSLIEEFRYPKLGPGQLWEVTAEEIQKRGGRILLNAKVTKLFKNEAGLLTGVSYLADGTEQTLFGDIVISSMPLKDLIVGMPSVPENVRRIAEGLPYRDYMTVGVLVKHLALENKTKIKTLGNIVPDCWIYVQDKRVKLGRLQIYNNWSPYMVKDIKNTVWLGLEYFVREGDECWTMEDAAFARFAVGEMLSLGLISSEKDVLDTHVERVKKAYPAYFDTYSEIDVLRQFLNSIENLYCIGRNGQHRYNNIDHSMCTAFEAVKNIRSGIAAKDNIWAVNTETDYQETQKQ